ncbi:hypothetical protein DFH06DRAFT_1222697 [Mycena polygramma]|nr:hypothetical protein DFH06DRAFT_1222697 [Mycena polygramma]
MFLFTIFVFCAISSLFGGGCWNRGGGGGGGGSASIPSGPPPIPPCPSGFWRPAGGQCTSVVANCPAGQMCRVRARQPPLRLSGPQRSPRPQQTDLQHAPTQRHNVL